MFQADNERKFMQKDKRKGFYNEKNKLFKLANEITEKIQRIILEIKQEIIYDEDNDVFLNPNQEFILKDKKEVLWNELISMLNNYNSVVTHLESYLPSSFKTSREGFLTDSQFLRKALFNLIMAYYSFYFLVLELQKDLNFLLEIS